MGRPIVRLLLYLHFASISRGQDLPTLTIPTLQTNVTYRSSFCYVYDSTYIGNVSKRDAILGKHITVGLLDYQLDKKTGGIDDQLIDTLVMDELAKRAGFKWRETYGVIEAPTDSNGYSYNQLLFWGTDVYDMLGLFFIRNTKRLEHGIDFVEEWFDGTLVMVMEEQEQEEELQWFSFFKPFQWKTWLLIIGSTIGSGIVYFLVDYFDSGRDSGKMEESFGGNIFFAIYAFTGNAMYNPRTVTTRVVAFSICLMFMVITAIYTANMAALLVNEGSKKTINSMEDAIGAGLTFCVWKATAAENFLDENYRTAKKIALDSKDKCAAALVNQSCQVYLAYNSDWEVLQNNARYNEDCNLKWVGRPVASFAGSFTIKDDKNTCSTFLTDVLTIHMVDMQVDGTLAEIWKSYSMAQTTRDCENEADEDVSSELHVSVKQMGSLFILHFGVSGLALIVAIIRYLCTSKGKGKTTDEKERGVYARAETLEITTTDLENAEKEKKNIDEGNRLSSNGDRINSRQSEDALEVNDYEMVASQKKKYYEESENSINGFYDENGLSQEQIQMLNVILGGVIRNFLKEAKKEN